ncbi:hypothetical protein CMI37_07265 [Candidatus Pacearchaeota archaeon]|nr:hypothetical protein [Candidatus Pacearchaeota archaeon]
MRVSGNIHGVGGEIIREYHIGATFGTAGVIAMATAATPNGIIPNASETTAVDVVGVTMGTATYSATPAVGALGTIEVSVRPDSIVNLLMSGGGTEGTALTVMTNTVADASTPDTITSGDAQANSMIGGTVWRRQRHDNEAGLSEWRVINAHTGNTSVGFTVDLEYGIAVNDQFLMCPFTLLPGDGTDTTDGHGQVNLTDAYTEADCTVASGTGLPCTVYNLRLRDTNNSEVEVILDDHIYRLLSTSAQIVYIN